MEITIDKAMNNLNGILTEATEGENSVCYVTENDAETLLTAISTMRKYQKIKHIINKWDVGIYDDEGLCDAEVLEKISMIIDEVENGNVD